MSRKTWPSLTLVILAAQALGGCSWFFGTPSTAPVAGTGAPRKIEVEITASRNVNPNAQGQAQPIKVCVIETSQPGWLPEHITSGAPCRDGPLADGVVSRNQSILQPDEARRYHFEIPAHQTRWIVVGAEFQQLDGALYLVEQKSPAQNDSDIRVQVGMRGLSVVANDKQMDR